MKQLLERDIAGELSGEKYIFLLFFKATSKPRELEEFFEMQ
jgi:hypothetical protein